MMLMGNSSGAQRDNQQDTPEWQTLAEVGHSSALAREQSCWHCDDVLSSMRQQRHDLKPLSRSRHNLEKAPQRGLQKEGYHSFAIACDQFMRTSET